MYNFGNSTLATATKNPNQDNRDAVDKSPPPKANGVAIATLVSPLEPQRAYAAPPALQNLLDATAYAAPPGALQTAANAAPPGDAASESTITSKTDPSTSGKTVTNATKGPAALRPRGSRRGGRGRSGKGGGGGADKRQTTVVLVALTPADNLMCLAKTVNSAGDGAFMKNCEVAFANNPTILLDMGVHSKVTYSNGLNAR